MMTPVFLCGFPRSGTTLMDRFLRQHPKLVCTEERPFVENLADAALNLGPPASWDANTCGELRQRYVEMAALPSDCGRLVDRMPINFLHMPIIKALWPDAPVIFMVRHPVDVCLSCFMQDFRLNPLTAHFRSFDSTLQFYVKSMKFWLAWRNGCAKDALEIRYEDLVVDSKAQVERILQRVDLPWVDEMASHDRDTASATASYHQVGEAIYTRAVGRWQRFRKHVEPWISELEPVSQALGYGSIA